MDRETRNRIQRATQGARALLEREYAEQLDGTFDIRLDGTIADAPGDHLDVRQRLVRSKLVAAIEHLRASGHSREEASRAYLREAAFTTLNRFVALKMLEARGLVQECVSRGEESSGFKEFTGLAPGLVQLPDHGYRLYIECLFDEIGREVRVLFDHRDPTSLLWPRRQALLDLLGDLNATELSAVWGEDETIGWVYQYFNSDEERRQMRAESQAPRSSRELAVRNQFFTPRYVVQFLTDNTLGRIWYEMRQGETRLRDLDYLVRRPNEVFLAEGEEAPAEADVGDEDLTQEDLLQRPVYVPYRAKKDPRDIRVLDPACGSGHFLIYSFDLLLRIYEEARADEAAPRSEATGRTLRADYPEVEALRSAIPRLILRHNLHGIDIDARCAQIAALALWMRAQRSFKDLGVSREARPTIEKTNIVVAEPMPGEPELRREFSATLEPRLHQLVDQVIHRMEMAAEAGTLLQLEKEIGTAIREIYGEEGALFHESDKERWQLAEAEVLQALRSYAEQTTNGRSFQRRLFSEDAARGLGFVDLCRLRYDVVVMNPPFGSLPSETEKAVAPLYHYGQELGIAFCERASTLCHPEGIFGAVLNSNFLLYRQFTKVKQEFLFSRVDISVVADLGWDVLDAQVRILAAVAHNRRAHEETIFVDVSSEADLRVKVLREAAKNAGSPNRFCPDLAQLRKLPGFPIAYKVSSTLIDLLTRSPRLGESFADVTSGARPLADFFRAWWEVPLASIGSGKRWRPVTRGGAFQEYCRANYLVIDWRSSGEVPKAAALTRYPYLGGNTKWLFQGEDLYFRRGLTYSKRSEHFAVQAISPDYVITEEGQAIIPHDSSDTLWLSALLNSAWTHAFMAMTSGLQKQEGYVRNIPIPRPLADTTIKRRLEALSGLAFDIIHRRECRDECYPFFAGIDLNQSLCSEDCDTDDVRQLCELRKEIDAVVLSALDLNASDRQFVVQLADERPEPAISSASSASLTRLQYVVGLLMGRWKVIDGGPHTQIQCSAAFDSWLASVEKQCGDRTKPAIHVLDEGHEHDLAFLAGRLLTGLSADGGHKNGHVGDSEKVRDLLAARFFSFHIDQYTRARRKAPIYWQLSTPSASYSVWLYYHRLTRDSLYRVLNDYVTPKLKHEERKLTSLSQDAGLNPSSGQRKEIDAQQGFVAELRAFRDEVARVAPLWNPDLNDGVIINFAPLWRLVPQNRAWQKECKAVWDKLVKGDYDWAHLAMHLWPERVVPKCGEDRSLSIIHNLEEVFWDEDGDCKWKAREVSREVVDRLVEERTSAAVKSTLDELLRAPAPAKPSRERRSDGRRRRSPNSSAAAPRSSRKNAPSAVSSLDNGTLEAVKRAIAAAGDGASKSDVVEATGISNVDWNAAISVLLAQGAITKTGAARGTRYHLAEKGRSA